MFKKKKKTRENRQENQKFYHLVARTLGMIRMEDHWGWTSWSRLCLLSQA